MPFKMHEIIFFPDFFLMCLPYLKFLEPFPETRLFLYLWPYLKMASNSYAYRYLFKIKPLTLFILDTSIQVLWQTVQI